MKNLQRIIENTVFIDSVVEECRRKSGANVKDEVNRLLIEKAQELGLSLYEVCANYVPEIKQEIIEIDWYKEKLEGPEMAIETTIRLVLRD
ncbi:MAG: hypothetical protein II289_00195 [Bacteroidales bacterium]|nr:hypothetical protein [Bacteroidales bacterium]